MMVVRLQTTEGETKEYITTQVECSGENGPCKYLTKCGLEWKKKPKPQDECDHLDCAIASAEYGVGSSLLSFLVSIAFIFMAIFGNTEKHTESLFESLFLTLSAGFFIILAFLCLIDGFRSWMRSNELTEYRDKGTINGIVAFQTSEDPYTRYLL